MINTYIVSNRVWGVVCDASERAISCSTQDSESTTGGEQHKVGGSKVGVNECPFQQLREGHRKDTKRTRGKPDRNVAPCSRLTTTVPSSAHSMNARKCVHAQKPYPSQAFAHESSKVGGKER